MVTNLSEKPSLIQAFLSEIRSEKIQGDRMRFRRNLERVGEIMAYEISKELTYENRAIDTPLGTAQMSLPSDRIVLATILRAGLPLHQGLLNYFDGSGSAFVSAFRKHHKDGSFDVHTEYVSCPSLDGAVLIISDPMVATGASMALTIKELLTHGQPTQIHVATAIAATYGIDYLERLYPDVRVWAGAVDEELTAKSYIVPGLGDAGDLAYGEKIQD